MGRFLFLCRGAVFGVGATVIVGGRHRDDTMAYGQLMVVVSCGR